MTHCGRFLLWTDTSAGLAAADDEDGGVDAGRGPEGAAGYGCAHADPEAAGAAGRMLARHGALQHQVGGDQPGARRAQQAEQAGRDPVRRAGHDPERPTGQPQAGGVRVHDGDLGQLMTEPFSARRVQLDRDDPGTRPNQGCGERALARPDVKNELAGADPGLRDDPRRPLMIEPVPSPGPARRPGGGGHGGP